MEIGRPAERSPVARAGWRLRQRSAASGPRADEQAGAAPGTKAARRVRAAGILAGAEPVTGCLGLSATRRASGLNAPPASPIWRWLCRPFGAGFEPATRRLSVYCSPTELSLGTESNRRAWTSTKWLPMPGVRVAMEHRTGTPAAPGGSREPRRNGKTDGAPSRGRNDCPADYCCSAATPGSSLPSIHSRKAPPAVETKVKSAATPA